ncbi:MAG: uracil-DNA glycosylase [Gemmatimonadaceae bacterium]
MDARHDARQRLRRYLEQRREMGERELILDGMSVEQVLRIVGADAVGDQTVDWRATLRAASEEPAGTTVTSPDAATGPSYAAVGSSDAVDEIAPTGVIVGSASRELFRGPLGNLASLEEIANVVAGCDGCTLRKTSLNPVPGAGNPDAALVCVGEAPGATEDETGIPFTGRAGELLTRILAAIDLRRDDVFICNVLKHRPPSNRNPRPEEIAACSPFLLRQLELIRPTAVLALGTFAAQTLLETKLSIGRLRGQVHRYHGIPLIVTYHPAALLRNPAWKRPAWDDVRLVRRILDRDKS